MGTQQQREDGRIDMPDLVVVATTTASPMRIYATLADLSTHTTWAGTMHGKKNFGLRTLEASADPAIVGTEFHSTGDDPMGTFTDRSVVTEATDPSVFEFVTEGHLQPRKRGKPACDTRITYRFEIAPKGTGSAITYRVHLTRWTNPPALLRSHVLRPVLRAAMKSSSKKMLRNLTTYATNR
jgi:Polyketide cyclase / dehydrase and lipid transport